MAVSNEKVSDLNAFIITAGALGITESQFYEKLIASYPTGLDFSKIRTPSEYLEFRQNLAIKFLTDADLETSRKISIALFTGTTTNVVSPSNVVQNQPKMSKRQAKNRRSRVNKSSKKKQVVKLPWTSKVTRQCKELGWPDPVQPPIKKPRLAVSIVPDTPVRPWVKYMPVADFRTMGLSTQFCDSTQRWKTGRLTNIHRPPKLKAGKFATRSREDSEYRHHMGLHTQESECDICDCVVRFHFFDDFENVTSRIVAMVVLHHWVVLGQEIDHFNWYQQTWWQGMNEGGHLIPMHGIGDFIKSYIENGRVNKSDQVRTYSDASKTVWTHVLKDVPDPKLCFRLTR
jgi:hypothetical protein